jgi:Na+/H+ antiporter NhaB
MKRTSEFVLGLIGGIFGAGLALLTIAGGVFGQELVEMAGEAEALEGVDTSMLTALGVLLLLLSVAAIVFSIPAVIRKNHILSGIIQLIAAVGGFLIVTFLWVVPGLLMIISGILCFRKPKPTS